MKITIIQTGIKSSLPSGLKKKIMKVIRKVLSGRRGSVNVKFVNDVAIRRLNKTFRKIDRATDVLSFLMAEDGILGDIAISVPAAKRNAKRYGASLENEILRLSAHGAVHLLGYDHGSRKEKKEFFRAQEKALLSAKR